MNLLFLSPDYPDDRRSVFPFVKQLVDEIANQGNDVQVIAPYSLTHNKRLIKQVESTSVGKGKVTVYRPYYLSLSNIKIGNVMLIDLVRGSAFRRGIKMINNKPDIVYGHFWPSAYHGFKFAQKNFLPLFVATGESKVVFKADTEAKKAFCDYIKGVISVSSKNIDESIQNGLEIKKKSIMAPNAYNPIVFMQKDRTECRKKLGFPLDAFIVAFCGAFVHRKGVKKLSDAIDSIDGTPVYSLFIGRAEEENPSCKNILYQGTLKHSEIADYLSAADVFVLPTLNEGCCNAIIEAIACGLPVISSDRSFNWDVLDKSNSILIDPEDSNQMAKAIKELRDNNELRQSLAHGSQIKAQELTIDKRAKKIMDFIKSKM